MRCMSLRTRSLSQASLALVVAAAALHAQSREPYPGLDQYVRKALHEWSVPGAAIARRGRDSA